MIRLQAVKTRATPLFDLQERAPVMTYKFASVADWPIWHDQNPGGTFSQWLKACVADDWHKVTHHPFTDAWGKAAVPDRNLKNYLIQDHRFIDRFVALLAGAVSRAPTLAGRIPACQFLALLTGPENTYFERSLDALGVTEQERHEMPDWDVTSDFKDLMRTAMESNDYASMLAVLAVAEGTYLGWADRVHNEIESHPKEFWYAEWLDLHIGDYFESVVAFLNDQLDKTGPTLDDAARANCLSCFRKATELEVRFFDAAWASQT